MKIVRLYTYKRALHRWRDNVIENKLKWADFRYFNFPNLRLILMNDKLIFYKIYHKIYYDKNVRFMNKFIKNY